MTTGLLFTKRSQALDFYFPEKIHDVKDAILVLTEDLMNVVSRTLTGKDNMFYVNSNINIALVWQAEMQGDITCQWLEAVVTTDTKE